MSKSLVNKTDSLIKIEKRRICISKRSFYSSLFYIFQYISVINDIPSAYLLSFIILLLMLILYVFEIKMRGNKSFHNSSYEHIQWSRYQLGSIKTIFVLCFVSVPIIFGYIIPVIFTLFMMIQNFVLIDFRNYFSSLSNSIILGMFVLFAVYFQKLFYAKKSIFNTNYKRVFFLTFFSLMFFTAF